MLGTDFNENGLFECGDLFNYLSGEYIRQATFSELVTSLKAAKKDGGRGVFTTEELGTVFALGTLSFSDAKKLASKLGVYLPVDHGDWDSDLTCDYHLDILDKAVEKLSWDQYHQIFETE